eukprot:Ihof_evm8s150 gene=Ihof_evmTU8s150
MGKNAGKKRQAGSETASVLTKKTKTEVAATTAPTDEELPKRWTNKQRVLVFCSRGITFRTRHLMSDMRDLLPHCKADVKLDRKDQLYVVNEVTELKHCNSCIFFEMRKHKDAYMWLSRTPNGPSAKFLIENVHTMDELKLTGNHLKGSRPLLSFDANFDAQPHHALLKEMFMQTFGTPYHHPKSKPFFDHVLSFSIVEDRIWFRNYQVVETGLGRNRETTLVEVGPRFVLNLIRIFNGSFSGATLYENPEYTSPNE